MELHLLLGIVNRFYDHVDDVLRRHGCSITAKDWSDKIAIRRPPLHGGEFNGADCKKLLERIDVLETMMENESLTEDGVKVLRAIEAFELVRQKCFRIKLQTDYKIVIRNFESAYKELGISVTSKVHAVFDHIEQFLDQHDSDHGLGFYSEQASESAHHDFFSLWQNGVFRMDAAQHIGHE